MGSFQYFCINQNIKTEPQIESIAHSQQAAFGFMKNTGQISSGSGDSGGIRKRVGCPEVELLLDTRYLIKTLPIALLPQLLFTILSN